MEFFTSPYCIQEDAAEMSISFQNVGNVTGPQNYHVNHALRIRFTCVAIGTVSGVATSGELFWRCALGRRGTGLSSNMRAKPARFYGYQGIGPA